MEITSELLDPESRRRRGRLDLLLGRQTRGRFAGPCDFGPEAKVQAGAFDELSRLASLEGWRLTDAILTPSTG